ncbi:MAG: alanine racemase, partial [Clostridia bacterium]|nr:alanine racemase [Clostridia bacterium]
MSYRLNTVTVDLKRLTDNARVMKGCLAPGTRMMAVIKANAYGHGIIQAAAAFNQTADCFGVAD